MRIILFVIALNLINVISLFAQTNREFTVKGKFPSAYYDGLKVYLNEIDYTGTNAVLIKDSTTVGGDKFTFNGTVDKPLSIRYVTLADNDEMTALIVLEPGVIELEMNPVPTMSGTVKNDELSEFTALQIDRRSALEKILEKAQSLHKAGILDEATSSDLEAKFNTEQKLMQQDVYNFVSKNILNEVGEFFFTLYASNMRTTQLETLYSISTEQFQNSPVAKSIMQQNVWSLGSLREGQKMKGMDMKSLTGDIEDIATHFEKGKVVLVDFWASWCGPCIKSMPIIVKLYDRYKDSGFEIVGISLDDNESSWKAAIKRLGMTWPQYIDDGGGWTGAAAREYNISRIPQTYLLDRKGNIAGHDLSGLELIEKIEELLNEE